MFKATLISNGLENVTFIVRHLMPIEKSNIFQLERFSPMMIRLILDVAGDG